VPDLGLSEDVFAGPQVSGADDLRAALSSVEEPAEGAPVPAGEPTAEQASEPAAPADETAEPAEPQQAGEPAPAAETEAEQPADESHSSSEEQPAR
jgi:hypothetical protein